MKLLARTQMLSRYSPLAALEVAHRLGFDGVEICLERQDWSLYNLQDFPVRALRERLESLNMSPCSFSLHQDYVNDDAMLALTLEAIQVAPELGADIFVFNGARRSGDPDEWARTIQRTRPLVEAAEACGVTLANEFEPGFVIGSTVDLLRLFEALPSPNLGANLDLGHAFICDPDPLESIRRLGSKIVHCHIENMPRGVHDHLLPQEGDLDLATSLGVLAQVGFAGGLALDLYKYDYEDVAPEALRYLRSILPDQDLSLS